MPSFDSTDLDNATSESGVVHQSTANTDHTNASELKQGYDYANFSEITPTPIACYPLHEDTGTTANDLAGTNDGTTNGGVSPGANGILNTTAYSFDGTDGEVDCGTQFATTHADPYTITGWAYHTGGSPEKVASEVGSGFEGFQIGLNLSDDAAFFIEDDTGTNVSATASNTYDGAWTHWVGVNTGSEIRLYINASDVASETHSLGSTTSGNFHIGARSISDQYWGGRITDVRFYDEALTPTEIQTLYDVVDTSGTLTTQYKPV